jgi:hypothetical protein
MNDRPNDNWNPQQLSNALGSEPGIGVARRASVLAAVGRVGSGPNNRISAGLTGGPQWAMEAGVDQALHGPPTSPAEVRRYRMVLLAGNVGLMVAGVLAQRTLNHSRGQGLALELGRAAARQVTVGAAAASIILVSDTALGPLVERQDSSAPATMAINAASLRGQSAALRKLASALTMPTKPGPFGYVG